MRNKSRLAGRILGCILLLAAPLAHAGIDGGVDGSPPKPKQPTTLAEVVAILQGSVVFLGMPDSAASGVFSGSGVILTVEGVFYLATARHVVERSRPTHVFVRQFNGAFAPRDIAAVKSHYKIDWVFHPQPDADIAVIPFAFNQQTDDIMVVPFGDGFVPKGSVLPSLDALFL